MQKPLFSKLATRSIKYWYWPSCAISKCVTESDHVLAMKLNSRRLFKRGYCSSWLCATAKSHLNLRLRFLKKVYSVPVKYFLSPMLFFSSYSSVIKTPGQQYLSNISPTASTLKLWGWKWLISISDSRLSSGLVQFWLKENMAGYTPDSDKDVGLPAHR